jgi:hypothetical protein
MVGFERIKNTHCYHVAMSDRGVFAENRMHVFLQQVFGSSLTWMSNVL